MVKGIVELGNFPTLSQRTREGWGTRDNWHRPHVQAGGAPFDFAQGKLCLTRSVFGWVGDRWRLWSLWFCIRHWWRRRNRHPFADLDGAVVVIENQVWTSPID